MAKKTWAEKLHNGKAPKVEVLDKPMFGMPAGTRLVIVNPEVVLGKVRGVRFGEFRDPAAVREELAAEYGAEACCPLTFGIFLRIVSEAAWDELSSGASLEEVAPFWRMVGAGSGLAKKLRCGREWLVQRQALEGIVG